MMKRVEIGNLLFVPGMRLDLVRKAFDCGADGVVIDWEDTVADADKAAVRAETFNYLVENNEKEVWIRINGEASDFFAEDCAALCGMPNVAGVLLPKIQTALAVGRAAECGKPVVAMVECSRAWLALPEIAAARGLTALTYGCLDLLGGLGCRNGSEAAEMLLNRLRGDLVLYSAANGLNAPVEGIFPAFRDDEGFERYLSFGRDLGFSGALCVHPRQIAVAGKIGERIEGERRFACRVLAAYRESGAEVFELDGQMIDKPLIERAKRLLNGV